LTSFDFGKSQILSPPPLSVSLLPDPDPLPFLESLGFDLASVYVTAPADLGTSAREWGVLLPEREEGVGFESSASLFFKYTLP
jgi:hypothetical protein